MSTSITFTGFSPEHPEGRDFSLWMRMPYKNRVEDVTDDLKRFIGCLQEMTNLLLLQVDKFTELFDPDLCSDLVIDDMLKDMGNPFDWVELNLTANQRRKLLRILIEIYKSKGTRPGIENTILFLLGQDVTVVPYASEGWVLGVDSLGDANIAQVGNFFVGPYDLSLVPQPWDLVFSIDGGPNQTVTLLPSDFANIASALAEEVSSAIHDRLSGGGSYVVSDGESAVMSGSTGPYALSGGDRLQLLVSGNAHEVVFKDSDFVYPGAATIDEVIKAIYLIDGLEIIVDPTTGNLALITVHTGPSATIEIVNDPTNTAAVPLGFSLGATSSGAEGKRFYVYSETVGRDASIEVVSSFYFVFRPYAISGTGSTILAPSTSRTLYSFDIETQTVVDQMTEDLIRKIAEYMKVAHEHLVNIRTQKQLPWPDGWQIGVSELGTDTELEE